MIIILRNLLPNCYSGLIGFVLYLCFFSMLNAGEIDNSKTELKLIQTQISNLQNKIKNDEKSLKKERGSLQNLEKEITAIKAKLSSTQAQVAQTNENKLALQAQADVERERIREHLSNMGDLVYSQHSLGDKGYIKLLLSQQDPNSIERTMVYYKYLAKMTADNVLSSQDEMKQLIEFERQVSDQQVVLNRLLNDQTKQQAQLSDVRKKRKQAIASLDNQLTKSANRVGRLKEDQKRIKKLVKGLQVAALEREKARAKRAAAERKRQKKLASKQNKPKAEVSATTQTIIQPIIERVSNSGLGKLKGRLKMPVSGKINARYGAPKQGSGIKWNGILVGVKEGEPVRSIHHGQVVYADWFKGFGQLVIVDHGQGYMSLYSHNSRINRSLGEQIKANDIIAYTGSSGGLSDPGLYFEVRYNGEPRDPLLWVKR